jgi:hypothetical protein
MKIATNSGDYLQYKLKLQGQVKTPVARDQNRTVQSSQDLKLQQTMLNRLQRERALGDALSVAQMSRSLIQKAIIISSQLRSIASQALTPGGIDQNELNQVVSTIDSSMQQFGEIILPPVTIQTVNIDIPVPIENLDQMREYSVGLGDTSDLFPLDKIDNDLLVKQNIADKSIELLTTDMRGIVPPETKSINENDILAISQKVIFNPQQSLSVQGNLQQDIIGQLL